MKHFYSLIVLTLLSINCVQAQLIPPADLQNYYRGVNFSQTGIPLFEDLSVKTITKHSNELTYTPGIWNASKNTDEDPNNDDNVLLIYGFNDRDNNHITDRSRRKNLNGGDSGTDWNREHTFPRSRARPVLDDDGRDGPPYADAHNLRPSDVKMNSNRGSRKFASGSGNAGNAGSNWYPGDEWKGDAARIVMYMYLRYGNQCLPRFVSSGRTNSVDSDMINVLLEWNAEDPVSAIEDKRNAYHDSNDRYAQGNRNPFIDNPFLATVIWGGDPAENRWETQEPDNEDPTRPNDLNAFNPSFNTVDLSWTASTDNIGVTGYDIFVDGSFYQTTGPSTTYTVTGLDSETNYSFSILAKDAAGNTSNLSNTDNETTLEAPVFCANESFGNIPTANENNYLTRTWTSNNGGTWTATNARTDRTITGKAITLDGRDSDNGTLTSAAISGGIGSLTVSTKKEFTAGPDSGTLKLYVNGDFKGTIPYSTAVTTTTIDNINVGGEITIVINDDSSGNRVSIDDLFWTCFGTLSNNDDYTLDTVSIYPNPAKGNEITIKSKISLDYSVYDILGKKILNGKVDSTKNTVSVASLNKGVYLIRLESETGSISKKLIKY